MPGLADEELLVLLEPALELLPLPALGKMVAEQGDCGFQFGPSEEPGEVVPGLMPVGAINAPPELLGKLPERKWVARVETHLEKGLLAVGREGAFSNDEAHNVADVEVAHGASIARCSAPEQREVPRGTVGQSAGQNGPLPFGGLINFSCCGELNTAEANATAGASSPAHDDAMCHVERYSTFVIVL